MVDTASRQGAQQEQLQHKANAGDGEVLLRFPAHTDIPVVSAYAVVASATDGAASSSNRSLPLLFTPLKIGGLELKNRIAVSPMCMYSSIDGYPNAWHFAHLSQFAIRGAGLVMIEATGVTPNGRITPHCTGIWSDDHIPAYRHIANFAHTQGAKVAIQLAHAGRKAGYYSPHVPKSERVHANIAPVEHGGWPHDIVAASAIKGWETEGDARAATLQDIAEIVEAFGEAARRSLEAEIDIVEIHAAHGYLIHQFLSPLSNKREDAYDGSFENRIRILVEIVKSVRVRWPEERPLFVRLSCCDWAEGGWTNEDTIALSKILVSLGVDLIDCSSGGLVPSSSVSPVHPHLAGWNVPFSAAIKEQVVEMRTGVVGGIAEPAHAESILKEGKADLILMAREFLRNADWVAQAAKEFGVVFDAPVQYRRAGARPALAKAAM